MKTKKTFFVLAIFLCLASTGCGMKVTARGRVIDADTGHPIENAAVAIYWVHEKIGIPGLPTPTDRLGTTETLTDEEGEFTIPRYLGFRRRHFMGVYKEGYICWSSETEFNPYGTTYKEIFQKRKQKVRDDMLIRLRPMPDDISFELRKLHSHFTVDVETFLDKSRLFANAIENEKELHEQILRKNAEEK